MITRTWVYLHTGAALAGTATCFTWTETRWAAPGRRAPS
jgi:hypothetical protein